MKVLFCLILLALFSGCEKNPILYHPDPKWDIADDIYNNQIGKPVFLQLKKEKRLHLCESGWGLRGRKNIRCMHCGFDYFQEITLEEARKLLLEIGNLYLSTINANERIRPFLENYPFGPENIEIRVFLYNANGSGPPAPEKLQTITIVDGKLRYKIGELDSRGFRKIMCEETYEEALEKLKTVSNTSQSTEDTTELPRSEIFPPENGKPRPLHGKIVNGRYYAPKNVFSCQADDFGEGTYLAQDVLIERAACVGFYNKMGNSKKADIMFVPRLEKKTLDRKGLKDAFDCFGIGMLKSLDNAQGIEILFEEQIDDMFFAAISIEKMSVLFSADGKHMASTRGYLIFKDKDKLAVLCNQRVTPPGQKHTPNQYIENLKQEILNFRKTFEFGAIPISTGHDFESPTFTPKITEHLEDHYERGGEYR